MMDRELDFKANATDMQSKLESGAVLLSDISYSRQPLANTSSGLGFNLEATSLDISNSAFLHFRTASRGSAIYSTKDS